MTEQSLEPLLRPELAEFSAYVPVQGEYAIRLDANEAPALLSERARRRLTEIAAATAWHRYPDATLTGLSGAIAAHCAVSREEVLAGVGSDELITMLLTALGAPRGRAPMATVLTVSPTFVMYRMSARVRGMRVLEVPLDGDWDLAEGSLEQALGLSTPNLIFIASPNNPTGNLVSRNRLEHLIELAPQSLVVIDEAYVDYAPKNQIELYRKYPNVAILRTLSKIGFAALRVGWLLAPAPLVRELNKVRLPYNLNSLAQALATTVLTELGDEIASTCQAVIAERERLAPVLRSLAGVTVSPSDANFLWLKTERPAGEVFEALGRRGILVRSFHNSGGRLAQQLRVTVGTGEENDRFVSALGQILEA